MISTAIYIHIPFCDHKCIYCDFYSLVSYDNIEPYLIALKKEIKYFSKLYNKERVIDTIFFGGGTPSYMSSNYIVEIINEIYKNFNVSQNAEITLETNPGTVGKNDLLAFKEKGINRLSIGIQSFDEKELKFLTRIHDKNTAIETVNIAAEVGYENINVDLIFSLPNQSEMTWISNLKTAISLPIQHISAYSLILERGTILNKMVLDGKVKMTSENHDAKLYGLTMEILNKNGFIQYEISNFAKPNFECNHNLYYWQYNDYLSFGTSAHSFINGRRWWNYSSLKKYISEINTNGNAVRGSEELSNLQKLEEIIMLGLRSKGIDMSIIKNYSKDWYIKKKNLLDNFVKSGHLVKYDNSLRCTAKGYLICDEMISKLI